MTKPRVLLDGLRFPEGPRWRDGRLWFSDMHDGRVLALAPDGKAEEILALDGDEPSGLGWLPDGRLLVVAMQTRRLLRRERDGRLVPHADLAGVADFHANDMVVDGHGRAYVGNFGFDLNAGATPRATRISLVHPDGRVETAADDMMFPNGSVLTPDGRTLIVGESFRSCLTAFDVGADGRLSKRRVWAQLERCVPDGICLDAEGCVWVASPVSHGALRVREGGEVVERVEVESQVYACMLGGADRKTLHLCTAATHDPAKTAARTGRIETIDVAVPGAGLP